MPFGAFWFLKTRSPCPLYPPSLGDERHCAAAPVLAGRLQRFVGAVHSSRDEIRKIKLNCRKHIGLNKNKSVGVEKLRSLDAGVFLESVSDLLPLLSHFPLVAMVDIMLEIRSQRVNVDERLR